MFNKKPKKGAFSRHAKKCTIYARNRWPIAKRIKIDKKKVKTKIKTRTEQTTRQIYRQTDREREKRWNLIQRINEGRFVYQMVAAALQTGQLIFMKFITHSRFIWKKNLTRQIQIKNHKRISEMAWFLDVPHSSPFLHEHSNGERANNMWAKNNSNQIVYLNCSAYVSLSK